MKRKHISYSNEDDQSSHEAPRKKESTFNFTTKKR